jgi:hypothetical protein
MTPQQKSNLKWLVGTLAAAVPALGWALTSGASAIDLRYVHQSSYERHLIGDSIRADLTQQKLDEVLLRVQQMQCGAKISNGCR